jgi:hypothetical protein
VVGDAPAALTSPVWRHIRIGFLLLILAVAAWSNWYDMLSTTDWDETLTVGVFPIDDASDTTTDAYLRRLTDADVADIDAFFSEEAERFGLGLAQPVRVKMYPPVSESPPQRDADAGVLATMWWSLRMRLYASRASRASGLPPPQIRIFVHFHNPEFTQQVPHSVGLQKGLVGVVHAYGSAELRGSNNVVIAHEILHTLGATDKYDARTLAPLYPSGFAEPEREPRYPQRFTEIMAGRYAVSADEIEMPESLDSVLVGEATALEIRWVKP